ncbi:hypothetical protein VNO80_23086 [Phaseolus coccineus]|uniref:Uncharacterized protein n=1 Tax=Phaseolus coccineus TaxID=3886 RepID=A0AAN9QZE3_PHACN
MELGSVKADLAGWRFVSVKEILDAELELEVEFATPTTPNDEKTDEVVLGQESFSVVTHLYELGLGRQVRTRVVHNSSQQLIVIVFLALFSTFHVLSTFPMLSIIPVDPLISFSVIRGPQFVVWDGPIVQLLLHAGVLL